MTFNSYLDNKNKLRNDKMCSKVNGYTFRGSNSAIFIFASHAKKTQLLWKRTCSSRSKFFPLRVDSNMERLSFSRDANWKL